MFGFGKKTPIVIRVSREFTLGQIVYHKLGGTPLVICGFSSDEYGELALCARSQRDGDEGDYHLAELTTTAPPPPVAAVETSAASTTGEK